MDFKMAENKEFKREDRYLVIKRKDLEEATKQGYISDEADQGLNKAVQRVRDYRRDQNKPDLTCVIVESHWKLYEPVWKALEQESMTKDQAITQFREAIGNAELRHRIESFLDPDNKDLDGLMIKAQLEDIASLLLNLKYSTNSDVTIKEFSTTGDDNEE